MSKGPREVITPPSHKNEIEPITGLDKIFNETQTLLINRKWAWAINQTHKYQSLELTSQQARFPRKSTDREENVLDGSVLVLKANNMHPTQTACSLQAPRGQSGLTGGPLGPPPFLSVLLECQWEQTKGTVSFAGCTDPQAFLWTKSPFTCLVYKVLGHMAPCVRPPSPACHPSSPETWKQDQLWNL